MKKKLLAVCTSFLMAVAFFSVAVTSAVAAEMADPGIYIEKSADSARVYPGEIPGGDYLRFRALFLTEDGTPADTFKGVDIENCNINITLDNATLETKKENVEIAYVGSAVEPKDITFAALDAAAGNPDADASFEFAISVDEVRTTGTGILTLTLDNGTATVTESLNISFKVTAPLANGYVVRTGEATSIEVGEIVIPATTEDDAEMVFPETDVSVTVFAVYSPDNGKTNIFTDNVPVGAASVTVTGRATDYGDVLMKAIPEVELTDGKSVPQTLAITDLKIPECLTQYALANATLEGSDHIDEMNTMFTQGIMVTWSAISSVTREIGPGEDDTDGGTDGAIVEAGDIIGTLSTDITVHGVSSIDEIKMVALPVNAVKNGAPVIVSVGTVLNGNVDGVAGGAEVEVSPLDAYLLLDAPEEQPATFTAVCNTTGYMYGALMGWDTYDNPAPVALSTGSTFPMSVDLTHITDMSAGDGKDLETVVPSQAFVPFAIHNDNDTDIFEVYVADIATGAETTRIKCFGEGNGIKFTGVASATQTFATIDFADPTAGSVEATLGVQGLDNQTYTITKSLYLDPVAGTQGELEITETDLLLSNAYLAEAEYNINTAITADTIALYVLQGENDAWMITSNAITEAIVASDTVASVELEHPGLVANVVVGTLGSNNKISFVDMYKAYDALGNEVAAPAGLQALPVDSAGAELTTPWAEGEVDDLTMNYLLNFSAVPADGIGYVQLRSFLDDTVTGDPIKTNIRIISGYEFSPVLSAAAGWNIPVLVNLIDQAGKRVAPVDLSTYTVEITTDNASTTVATSPATITSEESKGDLFAAEVFVIDPAASLVVDDTIVVSASANGFLGLKTYSIVLDVAVDIEKPTINIDDVTVGTCTIIIPVEDNVGVDIAATYETLTVEDSTQTDVTKDCEDISDANGTEIKVDVKNLSNGLYTISITAIDLRGNEAAEETITSVFVSGCGENAASCFSVSPTYLLEGTTGDVLIAGINTTFDNTTVVTGCSDVTVGTITLTSDNKLTVSVTAGEVDSDTTCNLTVSTGDEVFTCTGEFEIQDVPVECLSVAPKYLAEGTEGDVFIFGTNTTFDNTTVVTGCLDVHVGNWTITSPTELMVSLTAYDVDWDKPCNLTVSTGEEEITCTAAFEIQDVPVEGVCLSVAPTSLTEGTTGEVVITTNTSFDSTSVVTGCSDVTVGTWSITSETELTVTLTAGDVDEDTTCDLTVSTGDEEITCTGKFQIQDVPVVSGCLSVAPISLAEGTTGDVVITGTNTSFDSTTVVTGCSDVEVGTVTITSENELTVTLTAGDVDSDTTCDLTVSTGDEEIACVGKFQIQDVPVVVEGECLSVSPTSLTEGTTGDVFIFGTNTSFDSTTEVTGCSDVTVGAWTIISETVLKVTLTAEDVDEDTTCNLTVSTGDEVFTCTGEFQIQDVPVEGVCLSVAPTSLKEGTTGDVVITGSNTSFDSTTVVTGCSDVTVGAVTITSDNELTVTLTAGDVDSDTTCNLTVSTGDEVFTCTGEFQIQDEPDVSCEITVSPSSVTKRLLFPRLATFTVTGNESCDTLGDSSVTFSDTRIWPLRLRETSDGSLEVTVVVWPRATVGPVTMTVGDETTMITVNAFGS